MKYTRTNWKIVEGCLEESVYYDTSSDVDNLLEAQPLLLTKPDIYDDHSAPCEISIYFREKHNIFRVYVRSTAQAYEIYLSSNQQTSSKYLCTVHCKAVIEDISTNQIHYEATTDIAEVDPCLSLTICFPSIYASNYIYIDEIYVYADPIETFDPCQASISAMLLSSLAKLPNSSTIPNEHSPEEKSVMQEASTSNTTNIISDSYHEQSEVNHNAIEYHNQLCICMKKLKDDLVTNVDRLEILCSKLEEKPLKPFDSEMRMQKLEQKLDSLAIKNESSYHCFCSRKDSVGSNVWDLKNNDSKNEMSEKYDEQTGALSFDDLSSLSAIAYEEDSDMIVKSPKFVSMFDSEGTFSKTCLKLNTDSFEEGDDECFGENMELNKDNYVEAIAESMETEWDVLLCDVKKCTQDRDWVADLSLELMQTDISDTTLAEIVTE